MGYAIRIASQYGRIGIIRVLIEYGANIHAINDSAIIWVVTNSHLDIALLFVGEGVNIDLFKKSAIFDLIKWTPNNHNKLTPNNHNKFTIKFCKRIEIFLLVHHEIYKRTKILISKFVRFEIFKKLL